MEEHSLLTLNEVAVDLGRSYSFVRRLVDEGELPAKVIHGRRYVAAQCLEDWLGGHTKPVKRERVYSWK